MESQKMKLYAIICVVLGVVCLALTFVSDLFLIVGFILLGVSFIFWDKVIKVKKNQTTKTSEHTKQEIIKQSADNYELLKYKELISNDFSLEKIDSNFKASLVIMALNQIKENANYNPNDLPFNIEERIKQIEEFGKKLFLQSKFKNFVAVDTETTGLSSESDRIIQIALIKVEGGAIVDKFVTFVNPKRHIKAQASEINNIYDSDVKDAKTIKELFPTILEFIGKYPIVMHNAKFDMAFLKAEYLRSFGEELPKIKYICTMKLWRTLFFKYQEQDVPNAKLNTLVLNLLNSQENIDYQNNKHSADCDAIATCKVFMKMYDNEATKK